jgi:hypothetical protein
MAKASKSEQEEKAVKTSLSIKPSKMKRLKILAAQTDKSVTDLVDEGIDFVLKKHEKEQ